MNALINAEIDTLPPLPQTITELQRVCLYEDTTIKQVADIIEKDPFLTADLIKYANSPIYGYMHKVDSVFQAVSMFGISSTKGLAIASAVKSTFTINLSPYKLTTKQFTDVANLKSAFLFHWYQNKKELLGTLMPCALVMHIGMVVIADFLHKNGKEEEFAQKFNKGAYLESENTLLHHNQLEVLESLFEHWNFETTMIEVVHHLNGSEIPQTLESYIYPLRVINTLINPFSIATQEQINQSLQFVRHYHLDMDRFNATLEKIPQLQESL